jgi:sec-independent protein translocase protein TatB
MLDISFSELLLCFVVALVVLGPERLPGIARGVGRWTGKARSYMRNLSAELDRESSISDFRRQIGDAKRVLEEESHSMKKSFDEHASPIRQGVDEVAQVAQAAASEIKAADPLTPPPPAPAAPKHEPLHHDPYV